MIENKNKLYEIIEFSIADCETKFKIIYPGLESKIFNNQHFSFKKQNNVFSILSDEKEISFLDSSNDDTVTINKEDNKSLIHHNLNISNSLSIKSYSEDEVEKNISFEVLKKKSNYENKISGKTTSYEETTVKQVKSNNVSMNKDEANKNLNFKNEKKIKMNLENNNFSNVIVANNINNSNNKIKSNFPQIIVSNVKNKDEQILNLNSNPQNKTQNLNDSPSKDNRRKDSNGELIIKGSKKHKLTFKDQNGSKLLSIIHIESHKSLNLCNRHNEDIPSKNNKSCCLIT